MRKLIHVCMRCEQERETNDTNRCEVCGHPLAKIREDKWYDVAFGLNMDRVFVWQQAGKIVPECPQC